MIIENLEKLIQDKLGDVPEAIMHLQQIKDTYLAHVERRRNSCKQVLAGLRERDPLFSSAIFAHTDFRSNDTIDKLAELMDRNVETNHAEKIYTDPVEELEDYFEQLPESIKPSVELTKEQIVELMKQRVEECKNRVETLINSEEHVLLLNQNK